MLWGIALPCCCTRGSLTRELSLSDCYVGPALPPLHALPLGYGPQIIGYV